ncbi:hypothetical protein ATANTOWER_010314 [Ataeniobius toweri]|uniref:Uncharacterized protein n=1 Tax=Ataeniobius toweri TaxID=208326 RepID=A0ABU7A5G7_9TELE|nr:hypothetical protein [Ataeniobius toweri]
MRWRNGLSSIKLMEARWRARPGGDELDQPLGEKQRRGKNGGRKRGQGARDQFQADAEESSKGIFLPNADTHVHVSGQVDECSLCHTACALLIPLDVHPSLADVQREARSDGRPEREGGGGGGEGGWRGINIIL